VDRVQVDALRRAEREVQQAGGSVRRGRGAGALPGVEADVVVVAVGGKEAGAGAVASDEIEAEDILIERFGRVDAGDPEVDVADDCGRRHADPWRLVLGELGHQALEVQWVGGHAQPAVLTRPSGAWAVGVQLDAIAFRVGQVERLADEVVGGALERIAVLEQIAQGAGEVAAGGEQDGEVVEAGGPSWGGTGGGVEVEREQGSVGARPEAQGMVVLIEQGEAQVAGVEVEHAIAPGDAQVEGGEAWEGGMVIVHWRK